MPRPADTYTHSQFEHIDTNNKEETVRCVHCKQWQGSVKVLNRKKEHLMKCRAYADWRAAGNGQDLPPNNPYNQEKRVYSNAFFASDGSPNGDSSVMEPSPAMIRKANNLDMNKYFDEFFDDSIGQKCMRVRCKHCGFVRAKNTTRQTEHLIQCKDFLATTEGAAIANSTSMAGPSDESGSNIWRGTKPNPNLHIARRGPNRPRGGALATPSRTPYTPPTKAPSLANHLLSATSQDDSMTQATQHIFLSHAGCGSLTANALNQWLAQIAFISRGLVSFTGSLIGKIRIPETANLQRDSTFRSLDLLCSAVNNTKKELEFLEATKRKYGLEIRFDEPKPATKGFVDLFNSAASPSSSLLEGMVLLWAIEHLFYASFAYAGTFATHAAPPPSTAYSLPTYMAGPSMGPPGGYPPTTNDNTHIIALREAIIENWKSENFRRFVEACKAIVDELANAQTSGNGRTEMLNCERVFKQSVWLWSQMFPDLTGMGEEDELAKGDSTSANGTANKPVEIDDENNDDDEDDADADGVADSPYGGTGLGAVAAANRSS